MNGSGAIETEDKLKAETLEVSLSGSGDIDLDLETAKAAEEVSGSGDIKLSGTSEKLDLRLVEALTVTDWHLRLKIPQGIGIGRRIKKTLNARISGLGSINTKPR